MSSNFGDSSTSKESPTHGNGWLTVARGTTMSQILDNHRHGSLRATPKNKVFYQIHEAKDRLGLSMLDMAVLVAEKKLLLSAALGGILVEDGILEEGLDFGCTHMPLCQNFVHGLVDLRPEDGWEVLRAGSHTINLLAAEKGHYRRLIDSKSNASGRLVTREDVGLRHEELTRYLAFEQSLEDAAPTVRQEKRRAPTAYDWEAAQLEAFRLVYFEGVPPSFGALIRHIQGWYIAKGGRVPDESTLKRRLKKFWTVFGPEAQDKAA
ncbi:MAG: hypothetical protein INF96_17160 [Roseomonas sp.]|nr:hypothetical protein [Roseomonas sp.]